LLLAGAAEAVHGVVNFECRISNVELPKDHRVERGATQREVVEGDVEEVAGAVQPNLKRRLRAPLDGAAGFQQRRSGELAFAAIFFGSCVGVGPSNLRRTPVRRSCARQGCGLSG